MFYSVLMASFGGCRLMKALITHKGCSEPNKNNAHFKSHGESVGSRDSQTKRRDVGGLFKEAEERGYRFP